MKYRIKHLTLYEYDHPVAVCYNAVHLMPQSTPTQSVIFSRVDVDPPPAIVKRRADYFGNFTLFFTIQQEHDVLKIVSNSEIDVSPTPYYDPRNTPAWDNVRDRLRSNRSREMLSAYQFAFASPYAPIEPAVVEYASPSFPPGRPLAEAILDLTARIHRDFVYEPGFTTIATPVLDVLSARRGVCQDFAHFQIACLRSLGLAARYVSGYMRTVPPAGAPRLVGADASHAWLSVYCPGTGWIDLDPTNNRVPSDEHITVAWGRDYGDVSPTRGVIFGGGVHNLKVSVDVEPV